MKVLYLCHRAPWPADKGDRLRSNAILEWLAKRHEVFLGAFADGGSEDEARDVADHLRGRCADVFVLPRPSLARGMRAAVTGNAISVEVFSSPRLDAWIAETVKRVAPDAAIGYSSQTAPALFTLAGIPRVLDMVDVDSEKWRERFGRSRNPVHWVEARRVRELEDRCVRELDAVLVTTEREAGYLGGPHANVHVMPIGVDHRHFARRDSDPGGSRMSFVGAMDYPPNAEGALWFAREVLPRIRAVRPGAEFVVIGRRPPDGLAQIDGVRVAGFVEDLRPALAACAIGVAPVLAAHGVQTKAVVTMSMGIPMVVTEASNGGLGTRPGVHVLTARTPEEFAHACLSLLDNAAERARIAGNARAFVEERCDWERNLAVLSRLLDRTKRKDRGADRDREAVH